MYHLIRVVSMVFQAKGEDTMRVKVKNTRDGLIKGWSGFLLCLGVFLLGVSVAGVFGCGSKGGGGEDDSDAGLNGTGDGAVDGEVDPGDGHVQEGDGHTQTYDAGWWSDECIEVTCQGHLYECGDCIDNDGDGLTDWRDPHCLGPCDNNESGFNTNIPGGAAAPCTLDCYFDQDSGHGNDDCRWDNRCDPVYQPSGVNTCNHSMPCGECKCDEWYAEQSQQCLDFCLPLVPNGCDCFGCCELEPVENPGVFRFIGSPGCNLNDLESCDLCTHVPSCYNPCGHCEICIGKPELPEGCIDKEDEQCPPGVQPCGQPGQEPCPEGYYCITGCCRPTVT